MKELAYVYGVVYMYTTITQFVLYVAISICVLVVHVYHHVSIARTVLPEVVVEEVCEEPARVVIAVVRVLVVVASSPGYDGSHRVHIHLQILERGASSLDGIHVRTDDGIDIFGCGLVCTVFIEMVPTVYLSQAEADGIAILDPVLGV